MKDNCGVVRAVSAKNMGTHSWEVGRGRIRHVANVFCLLVGVLLTKQLEVLTSVDADSRVQCFTLSWSSVHFVWAPTLSIQSNWTRMRTQMNVRDNDKNKRQHYTHTHLSMASTASSCSTQHNIYHLACVTPFYPPDRWGEPDPERLKIFFRNA